MTMTSTGGFTGIPLPVPSKTLPPEPENVSRRTFLVSFRGYSQAVWDEVCRGELVYVGFVTRLDVLFTIVCITSVRRARP